MDTLALVDPQQRDAAAAFPPFDPETGLIADFRRDLVAGMTALLTPEPVAVQERHVPGAEDSASVRTLLFRPSGDVAGPLPAIVYAHGGGMIAGTPDMMAGAHQRLAEEVGALVASVDYRLAPETPFPGGLEDVYAVLAWLHGHADALGVDPSRIAVMGDSGGGCLAAAAALLARDRGRIPVRAQILIYPMLDCRTAGPDHRSDDPVTGEFVWTRAQNRHAWAAVRGTLAADDPRLQFLSPAHAHDLSGLPPALIVTGALDLFRDEDIAFAQRLWRAGIRADLQVYAGAVHGFDLLPSALADRVRRDLVEGVRRLL